MTNKKSTKRALLSSVLALLLCISMLIGSTFAWFTDSVTSGTNQIVAGNLDVELEYKKVVDGVATEWATVKDATEIFDPNALWEPGRVEVVYLKVTNLGTLALKYQLGVNISKETPGTNVNNEPFKLSDHLVFTTVEMPDELTTYTDREAAQLAAGSEKGLKDYNGKTTTLEAKNEAGTSNFEDYVALIVYMPETVGNEANYLTGTAVPTIELGVNLYATQYTAETDSFGPDYDEDAWVDGFKVYNADDLQDALNNGETAIALMADIDTDETLVIPTGVAVDLNGKTLSAEELTTTGSASVSNGTLELPAEGSVYTDGQTNITLENVVIDSDDLSVLAYTDGSVTMRNVVIKNTSTSNPVQNYGGTMILENVTIAQAGDANTAWYSSALQVVNEIVQNDQGKWDIVSQANTTIESGNYTGKKALMISAPGGNVTINGGTFTGSEYAIQADFNPKAYPSGSNYESVITINGGTFNGALKVSANAKLVIYGGTFNTNPAAYVADGFKAVDNGNGTYTVLPDVGSDLTPVAGHPGVYKTSGENYYVASANALADVFANIIPTNAERAQSVNLMADIDLSGKIWEPASNMHLTFNGNGYTIRNLTAGMAADGRRSGFFGYAGGVTINDLTLENVDVTGSQVGAFAGAGEGLKINNCFLKGDNKINYIDGIEDWNGVGAITGVMSGSNVNVEIVAGATVTLNKTGFVTDPGCTFFDNLTGYLGANAGTVVNNGQIIVGVSSAADLEQIANSGDDVTVEFAADITGNATIMRNPGADVIIDGNENSFTGTMTIIGNTDTGSLTIQDVNFVAASGATVAIDCPNKYNNGNANNYVKHVTIDNCTFTDPDNSRDCVAVSHSSGGKQYWTLKNCTVDSSMHSFLQFSNVEKSLVIEGCKVYSKNGVNLNYGTVLEMTDCTFDVTGYAVRFGVNGATVNGTYQIANSTLKSANDDGDAVIIFRGAMTGSTLTLVETTLTGTPDITGNANVVR